MLCRSKPRDPAARISRELDRELLHDAKLKSGYIQLLLLGTGESGKTTIIKQTKIIHINGYNNEEKLEKVPYIKQNIHESIYTIVNNMKKLNPPVEVQSKAQSSYEFIMQIGCEEPKEYSNEYYDHVELLWKDEGVKEAFDRSSEYQLIDCAAHFLSLVGEIRKEDYVPSVQDILFCRVTTTNISKIVFDVPVPTKFGGGTAKFWMYDVGGQRGQRKKWISVFEDVTAVLFLIASSDFDLRLREDESENRLAESFKLFGDVFWTRFLMNAGMVVFLNKQDLLQKKIEGGKNVGDYFPEYKSYKVSEKDGDPNNEYENSKFFMRQKILDVKDRHITDSLTLSSSDIKRNKLKTIHVHFTIATDTNNVKLVFESVHTIILEINLVGALI